MADLYKIKQVAGFIREAGGASFIIGAGASLKAGIPLAGGLIDLVQSQFPVAFAAVNEADRGDYGKVMHALAIGQREIFFRDLLKGSKTNWGHIALAALLRHEKVRRILTFNFDLVMERAASMLGVHVPVYDFGASASSEVDRIVSPSIVHMHGQGHGLVLLNSEKETKKHAARLRPILTETVQRHVTVVVGYSGKSDAAYPVIHKAFNSHSRLFWLGHSEDPPAHLAPLFKKDKATYIGGCDFDRVMIQIATELGAWPPTILENPMDHVLKVLEPTAEFPVGDDDDEDFLPAIRARLNDFSNRWKTESTPESRAFDAGIGIADPAAAARPDNTQNLPEGAKTALAWVRINEGNALLDEAKTHSGEEARAMFAQAGEKYAAALAIKSDMHEALNNWGNAIGGAAQTLTGEEARAMFAQAGEKYAAALAIKPDMHEALNNWGATLCHLSHLQSGAERWETLRQAEDLSARWTALTGKADYNLACIHALRGDAGRAVAQMQACQADGTLPDGAHLDSDHDLDGIRADADFVAFRAELA